MKVILLEKIRKLGDLGEIVNVKAGYARNFLIPTGKAEAATEAKIAAFEARRAELEKAANDKLEAATARAEALKELVITIKRKALEEGKLFGSVNIVDIIESLKEKNIDVEKRELSLPEGPIHETGEFEAVVQLHSDIAATIKIVVEAE